MNKVLVEPEELIYKHVPSGSMFQGKEHPAIVTSANFELQDGETGSSVTREKFTSQQMLLSNLRCKPESRVAVVEAKKILDLGFVIEPDPTCHDPGHAEIRSKTADLSSQGARRKLRKIFELTENVVMDTDESKVTWLTCAQQDDEIRRGCKDLIEEKEEKPSSQANASPLYLLIIAALIGFALYKFSTN